MSAEITITFRWHPENAAMIQSVVSHHSATELGEVRSIAFAGFSEAHTWALAQLHHLMTLDRYGKALVRYDDQLYANVPNPEDDADDDFDWNR